MGKRKKGKCARKNVSALEEPESLTKAPHSFVIHRGVVGKNLMALMRDFRRVMEPFTASALKVKRKNSLKDFVSVSGLFHVSHLSMFTITEVSPYMRLARLPQGPTLTFKINDYILSRDVLSSLRKQYTHTKCFANSPLIILNGFTNEGTHLRLVSTMFQSMFPTLNITKVKLNTVRRCVLLNYDPETKLMDFRHYLIRVTPSGLARGVKKLVLGKVPNLSRYNDVSDFIVREDLVSDMSDAEEEGREVVLPQRVSSKGNYRNSTSAIKLSELGPRMTLQLVKVEGGLMNGEVMFHEFVHKSEEEIAILKKQRREKRKLKEKRIREQELNVLKKSELKEAHKQKSLEGIKRKLDSLKTEEMDSEDKLENDVPKENNKSEKVSSDDEVEDAGVDNDENMEEDDDDAEWYRKEVGQEPEPELFAQSGHQNRRGGFRGKRGRFGKSPGRGGGSVRLRDSYEDNKSEGNRDQSETGENRHRQRGRGGGGMHQRNSRGRGGMDRSNSRGRGGMDRSNSRGRGGMDRSNSRGRGGMDRSNFGGRGGVGRGNSRGRGGVGRGNSRGRGGMDRSNFRGRGGTDRNFTGRGGTDRRNSRGRGGANRTGSKFTFKANIRGGFRGGSRGGRGRRQAGTRVTQSMRHS